MCTNSKWITNKYLSQTHHECVSRILVSCGHCDECKQEKANSRAKRIQYEFDRKNIFCLVVTLSYDNKYIPYFKLDEAQQFFTYNKTNFLPLYRDFSRDRVRVPHYRFHPDKRYKDSKSAPLIKERTPYRISYRWSRDKVVGMFDNFNFDNLTYQETMEYLKAFNLYPNKFNGLNHWHNGILNYSDSNRVPILYYKDVQNFFKKLRKNLRRRTGGSSLVKFRYFASGELGETYQRPHWHILIFFEPQFRSLFEECIYSSWSFCNLRNRRRSIEPAIHPAKYVSQYVNCSYDIPYFFQVAKGFKPSWHYSKIFGFDDELFSYKKICEHIDRGTLRYDCTILRKGVPTCVSLPYPKYVLNRFFPKFRGFTWLPVPKLCELLFAVSQRDIDSFKRIIDFSNIPLEFSKKDYIKLYTSLRNRFVLYGDDLHTYILRFSRVWTLRHSESLRTLHDTTDVPYCYDNVSKSCFGDNTIEHSALSEMKERGVRLLSLNPNKFPLRVDYAIHLRDEYKRMMKKRKVISRAYYK